LGDAGITVHERESAGDGNSGGEGNPRRIAQRGHGRGGEGARQHLAFKADVDDAGTLRKEPGQCAEDQRGTTRRVALKVSTTMSTASPTSDAPQCRRAA
jgi:hypothetical protein